MYYCRSRPHHYYTDQKACERPEQLTYFTLIKSRQRLYARLHFRLNRVGLIFPRPRRLSSSLLLYIIIITIIIYFKAVQFDFGI